MFDKLGILRFRFTKLLLLILTHSKAKHHTIVPQFSSSHHLIAKKTDAKHMLLRSSLYEVF